MKPENIENEKENNFKYHGITQAVTSTYHHYSTVEGIDKIVSWIKKRILDNKQVLIYGHNVCVEKKALVNFSSK